MTLPSQTASKPELRSEPAGRTPVRVLLLDANPAEAADLCAKLADSKQNAFSVRTVTHLDQGLKLLETQRFDVILADPHWAERRGISVIPELRILAPETPIIAITGSHSESEALEIVGSGAQDYVVKSRLNPAAIERILLYAMERNRATRRTAAQYAVSGVLAESETLEIAEKRIIRLLSEFCECDRGAFWQFDPWSGDLAIAHLWAKNPRDEIEFGSGRFSLGEGLPGMAWANGRPYHVANLSQCAGVPECDQAVAAGFRSAIAFPVRVGNETLAVIELFSRNVIDRDEEFLRLLMGAATQIGQFMARKAAENEKEHLTRERLLILDCASEGIYGVDLKGCITFMNRSAASMLKCAPGSVLGRNSHDLFCRPRNEGPSHSPEDCPIARTIAKSQGMRSQRSDLRRTDNSRFEAEFSVFPMIEGGEMKGAVICFSDVTDRKRMEVELRHSQKLEAVGSLAAGIAHEINTPIQFIGDNSRFLQDAFRDVAILVKTYDESCAAAKRGESVEDAAAKVEVARKKADWEYLETEIPKALEQTLDGVSRVARIVRSMKEFSHVDRSSEKAPGDLNKALESTLIVARNELKYVADVEAHYGDLPQVLCHLGDLNQVFLNLLINAAHAIADAVKGTTKKGKIGVTTRVDGDLVEIAVSDTGTGIPESVRDKIFDPFFTTKEVGKGTGQGLALARAVVVEKHGGTVTFETELGKGTTFFIRLPIAGVAETQEAGKHETNSVRG